ncbi:O-antigen polysaccharide polymerase Wzy family protein [Priestia flexa]|uniref:O-antigen polysaccharide polymerase Wzy family protein n=1 Tax=Priestia flexa TaxID=86664 RepID=UPI0010FC21A4|nr:O-antigen polysaccharide polymerase Wzy family protein [Priestia flexa]QCS53923.1 O-antigen polysaccharide polymerase Wzy [Priestia flexa]
MLKVFRYTTLFLSISIFLISLINTNKDLLLISISSLFVHNMLFAFERFNERIIFFAFNATFFTFLAGRPILKTFIGYQDYYNDNTYGLDFYDENIIWNIFLILFMSLLFIFLGYILVDRNKVNINPSLNNSSHMFKDINVAYIAYVSKLFFFITYIFNALVLIDKARFSNSVGYTELYAMYTSSFPGWFIKLSEMCPAAFFIYLGTLPTKKKSAIPILLYLSLGVLSLIVGQRNTFVLNILIVLVYLCLRNLTDNNAKWFGKKEIIACISAFPILILILNAVSYYRADNSVKEFSIIKGVTEFFYSQGASINLIGYSQTLASQMPDGRVYSLGRIIDFINNNAVTQILFDIPVYKPQTLESALYANSFADTVSYILSPNRYLAGWGYGSSYVAELYKDFGYYGIIIGSLLLGIVLALMPKLFVKGVLGAWAALSMTRLLLYSPRDTLASFLVTSFSLINILTVILILLGAAILKDKMQKTIHLRGR